MSRSALVVGINQYPNLNSLRLPAQDAEAIAQLLEQQGDFRITRLPEIVKDGQVMIGGNSQVTTAQLKKALMQLFKPDSVQIPDVALFYFAGHGVRDSDGLDDGYLATSDTNLTSVWGLSLNWLRQLLQQSPIKTQIVWLDCCYSGALINLKEADPNDAGLARSRCFIAASRAYEVAYEEIAGHHGVLTNVLLQGLDCRHKDSVNNLELTAFINQQLKTTTQAPVALNLGDAITLTFNRQQSTETTAVNPHNAPCPYKGLFYFDCNVTYAVQPSPDGLAQAFLIGEEFIGKEKVCMILGDNIFYGHGLAGTLKETVDTIDGATVFGYYVNDPQRYGVVEFDDDSNVLSIEEKPIQPKSNYAVTGLYFYDNDVISRAKSLKPSKRGELEITDLNRMYLSENKLKVKILGRGMAWLDTGTHESLLQASNYIGTIEDRQGLKVACLEEIAYKQGYIDQQQLLKLAEPLAKNQYGQYLIKIANEKIIKGTNNVEL